MMRNNGAVPHDGTYGGFQGTSMFTAYPSVNAYPPQPYGGRNNFAAHAPEFRLTAPLVRSVGGNPLPHPFLAEPSMNVGCRAHNMPYQGLPAGGGTDAHQTSFGSTNTSFSGPSTPAAAGPSVTTKGSRRHNPYASTASNGSTSEPSSPSMAPVVSASRVPPADASLYSSLSSATHSPVYAPMDYGAYGTAEASQTPASTMDVFSINEQLTQARGSLASAACTPRGRHFLIGALRQQQPEKIASIFEELLPHVAGIVLDTNGGHVMRTLVECINETQLAQLVEQLTPEVILTIATSSQNTRRVLQTIFERHHTTVLQPVIDVIAIHAIALSTTQQGCIAVMRCLEHSLEPQRTQVLEALTPQLAALTMDPYGNYVVQAVLQYFPSEVACEVLEKAFAGYWENLSCNKFASNVMEKLIQAAPPVTRNALLKELVYDENVLATIMQDGFGNFVLQQIIDTCSTGPEYRKLSDRIRPLLSASPFGHKIESKLKAKRFGPPYVNQENTTAGRGKTTSAGLRHNVKTREKTSAMHLHVQPTVQLEFASSSTPSSHRSQSNSSTIGVS